MKKHVTHVSEVYKYVTLFIIPYVLLSRVTFRTCLWLMCLCINLNYWPIGQETLGSFLLLERELYFRPWWILLQHGRQMQYLYLTAINTFFQSKTWHGSSSIKLIYLQICKYNYLNNFQIWLGLLAACKILHLFAVLKMLTETLPTEVILYKRIILYPSTIMFIYLYAILHDTWRHSTLRDAFLFL